MGRLAGQDGIWARKLVDDGLNGQGRVPFGPIVDEHIRLSFLRHGLRDQTDRILSHLRQLAHDSVVEACPLLGLFIRHFEGREQAKDGEGSRETLHPFVLLCQRRHETPMIVNMGNPVGLQHLVVAGSEDGGIAYFNGVRMAGGQFGQKTIQGRDEGLRIQAEALKFKNHGSGEGVPDRSQQEPSAG